MSPMSPSSLGHGGQYDTKHSLFHWILRTAFAGERICFFYVDQPVHLAHGIVLWHSPGSLTRRNIWDTAEYKRVSHAFEGMCV